MTPLSRLGVPLMSVLDPGGTPPLEAQPTPSILARTTRGAGWIVGFRMFTRILGSSSTFVVGSLLLPSEFGLWALGTASMQMMETFSYVGVEDALVREKAPSRDLYDTAFTLNLIRGVLIAVILLVAAYPASILYTEPALVSIMVVLAFATLVESSGNIGMVEYRRNFEFDREFVGLAAPRVLQVLVTIAVAVVMRNYLALVAGILVNRLSKWFLGYWLHPFRPRLSLRSWRHLLGFSAWTWVVSLAILLREQAPKAIIGIMMPVRFVGLFVNGSDLAAIPVTELVAPMSRAAFSGFSAGRHEGEDGAETYMRVVSLLAVVTLPLGIGLSALADPMLRATIGLGWLEAAPLIAIFSILSSFSVYGYLGWTLFFVYGYMRLIFVLALLDAVVRLSLMIWLIPIWGFMGGIFAVFVSSLAEDFAYIVLVRVYFATRFTTMWSRNWRFLTATATMALVLYGLGLGWVPVIGSRGTVAIYLGWVIPFGAAVYGLTLVGLWAVSGRPDGTEADMLRYASSKLRVLTGR